MKDMDPLRNFDPRDDGALDAVVEHATDRIEHEWGWYTDHVPALVAEIRRLRGTPASVAPKMYAHLCPYCGRQYRGPGGHSVGGDDCATSCFHRHPGERGVTQPRLVRVEVAPVKPLALLAVPHDVEPLASEGQE